MKHLQQVQPSWWWGQRDGAEKNVSLGYRWMAANYDSSSLLSVSPGRTDTHMLRHTPQSPSISLVEYILNPNEVTAHNIFPMKPLLPFSPRDKKTKQCTVSYCTPVIRSMHYHHPPEGAVWRYLMATVRPEDDICNVTWNVTCRLVYIWTAIALLAHPTDAMPTLGGGWRLCVNTPS